LMTSVAWADDLGYVECTSHPDTTPVFSKARQTPDSVGAIPCGERFTVLVYGFVFSRIQTKDGKIGYVYSNLITSDRGGGAASQAAAARVPVTNTPAKAPTNSAAQMDSPPVTTSPAPDKPAAARAGPLFPTPPPSSGTTDAASAPAAEPTPAPASASQPEAAQPAPAPVRDASVRSSWERPVPGARQNFLVELYSGYSFARFTSAGSSTNLNGGMG